MSLPAAASSPSLSDLRLASSARAALLGKGGASLIAAGCLRRVLHGLGGILLAQRAREAAAVQGAETHVKYSPFLQSLALLALVLNGDRALGGGGGGGGGGDDDEPCAEEEEEWRWLLDYTQAVKALSGLANRYFFKPPSFTADL